MGARWSSDVQFVGRGPATGAHKEWYINVDCILSFPGRTGDDSVHVSIYLQLLYALQTLYVVVFVIHVMKL